LVGKVIVVGDSGNPHDNKSDKGSGQGGYDKSKGSGKSGYDQSRKKPRFQSLDKDNSEKKGEDLPKECTICGIPHGGECSMKHHPNANLSGKPWKDSVSGKLFKPFKWDKLPKYKKLSDDKKSLIPYDNKERQSSSGNKKG